ncbi:RecA-superfamily ATPase possibly involved in signal transduction [Candidatus Filomicrobium marinum]|uniref:non-specific serine/threonine protein kinase n=2 Tax=Filomicrobium TaxID=119044 RepID=A0A0D6JDA7_9HYPH|nr:MULTISPECIES: ATPase domain-containing protein [Filomicrobium]MCV0368112.1 AAA family ATPase [Filomicrobium sp.]CFX14577.1 RecA-superfamily ATPase possibly involved in signal transduction [Candidatus Filomicrobium marinum]CPR17818.1 RecA-superfamily ATPase possibly involved in signal transduction [Candidatus Filomicrobium marinum]SDO27498.1 circadian clock protein KaiC [Filomicrobium insigne]
MTAPLRTDAAPIPTGVPGLDEILVGGYATNRAHLIEGRPGSGKTTLGLQFLLEGRELGETCLYITLSESRRELLSVASRHGWSLDGIEIFELVPPELSFDPKQQQSLVYSSDLELGETVRMAMAEIERVKPTRVVFDSLSEIRLLSQGSLRYRRQVLALKSYFLLNDATVLMLDDLTSDHDDLNLHSISHAVIRLDQVVPAYGSERRRVTVTKMRGTAFRGGYHDLIIERGGLRIFPRLKAAHHHRNFELDVIPSGVAGLDKILGGGLTRGTSTLIVGPSGAGKSTLALSHLWESLQRGEPALIISFDETTGILLQRAKGVGYDLSPHIDTGRLKIEQIDPADVSPGEFSGRVRAAVEERGTRLVVIDSLTGYLNAMPEQPFVVLQMHELLTYLNQQGVVTILILSQHGMVGQMVSPVDLTYLSDSVVMLRFFEANGRIRRALSVLKRRTGSHEDTIREFRIDHRGLRVGLPLEKFRGVLTGVPTFDGESATLLDDREVEYNGEL